MSAPPKRKPKNPFYALVLLVGLAFLLTACAYTVMAFLDVQGRSPAQSNSQLLVFLNQYGVMLMGVELAVLCVAMVAAFGTEDFWQRRFDRCHGKRTVSDKATGDTPATNSADGMPADGDGSVGATVSDATVSGDAGGGDAGGGAVLPGKKVAP